MRTYTAFGFLISIFAVQSTSAQAHFYDAFEFRIAADGSGGEHTWQAPLGANYLIVSGCGGGAGGAVDFSYMGNEPGGQTKGGFGGRASKWSTQIIPIPRNGSTYTIRLGLGGRGASFSTSPQNVISSLIQTQGGDTSLSNNGGGVQITFEGAKTQRSVLAPLTPESITDPTEVINGEDSVLGAGGQGNRVLNKNAAPQEADNYSGYRTAAFCAGGGGGGYAFTAPHSGGHGLLIVQPFFRPTNIIRKGPQ